MKKLLAAFITVLTCSQSLQADEEYSHFPALESTDVSTAICHIQRYNEKLTAITSQQELSVEDMVKVHELTYTLENAVNFLRDSLSQVSVDLEEVHKASERLDQKTILESAQQYLAPTAELLAKKDC